MNNYFFSIAVLLSLFTSPMLANPIDELHSISIIPHRDPNRDPNLPSTPSSKPSGSSADMPSSFFSASGVSPWDDSGRSQMLDHLDGWSGCPPRALNCRKCPRDRRCQNRPLGPMFGPPLQEEEPNAFASPNAKSANAWGEGLVCHLKRCDYLNPCGDYATCTGGYCTCAQGWKARRGGYVNQVRGRELPGSLSVFTDPGIACLQPCTRPYCAEVDGNEECFLGYPAIDPNNPNNLETDKTGEGGSGVVQIPGSAPLEGSAP
ncbi:hypothetical protein BS50DRAFT_166936 [Corynespora cassiicola Philippines]|uniref:EGF-like domain-containing protein n=1 Tax=Corynespora cassiicola Philippines TaxID=1448308 RepID=A0A2T2P4Y2_CORCC|nr:hypothetical protein BS50DRAFT_166936 [Corynespora cassiicola Philippines]